MKVKAIETDHIYLWDSIELLNWITDQSIHLILSDIPYWIGIEDRDVLHNNTNSAFLWTCESQKKAWNVFKSRWKPINWRSEADRKIPKEYEEWCKRWSYEWLRVLVPWASAFIFAWRRFAHRCISALEDSWFIFKDMIGWKKEAACHRAQRISEVYKRRNDFENQKKREWWRVWNLRPIFEPILWFQKPYKIGWTLADNLLDYWVGAFNDSLWNKFAKNSENFIETKKTKEDHWYHPTQKPLSLMEALIELTTSESDIVLDPFMWSWSTCVAAKRLNRKFIGFELNKQYFDSANERLKKVSKMNQSPNNKEEPLFKV